MAEIGWERYIDKLSKQSFTRGMAYVYIASMLASMAACALIGWGVSIISVDGNRTSSTWASVEDSVCFQKSSTTYNCFLKISYQVGSVGYKNVQIRAFDTSRQFKIGDVLEIHYNPKEPLDAGISKSKNVKWGWAIIGIGAALIVGAWIWFWWSRRKRLGSVASAVEELAF